MSTSMRESLPSTSSDFALPHSASLPAVVLDEAPSSNPLQYRFRRASLLSAPKAQIYSEARLSSPLIATFSLPGSSRIEGERGGTDSPTSSSGSENHTPPLGPPLEPVPASRLRHLKRRAASPAATPTRRSKSPIDFTESVPGAIVRRRSLVGGLMMSQL
jgi:hypothetical protein